jgi:predicted sulfurtransferase
MTKLSKLVTLADSIKTLESDPKIQQVIAKIKLEREVSPARHNRKFSMKLWEFATKIECASMNISMISKDIKQNGQYWSDADLDLAFAERKNQAQMLIDAQNEYDNEVAILEQAIIDEDNSKVS